MEDNIWVYTSKKWKSYNKTYTFIGIIIKQQKCEENQNQLDVRTQLRYNFAFNKLHIWGEIYFILILQNYIKWGPI